MWHELSKFLPLPGRYLSGRKSGDAVAQLVARFNALGLPAIEHKNGDGPKPKYGVGQRDRILAQAWLSPVPEQEIAANRSLITLRYTLRKVPDGLFLVSICMIGAMCAGDDLKPPEIIHSNFPLHICFA